MDRSGRQDRVLTVGLLVDARPSAGLGHLVRSTALAHALAAHAAETTLFLHGGDRLPLPDIGVPAEWELRPTDSPNDDMGLWARRGSAGTTKILVLDDPRVDRSYLHGLRQSVQVMAGFMDGHIWDGPFDVAINGTAYAADLDRTGLPSGTIPCFGPQYACLRPELRRFRRATRALPGIARRIMISLGGADPKGLTLPVARCVIRTLSKHARDGAVDVVIGPGFADPDAVAEAAARSEAAGARVSVHRVPGNMGELMSAADLAVSAGGGTLYELSYLGVPTIALAETPDEHMNAQAVARSGACVALESDGPWELELQATLDGIVDDPPRRKALRDAGLRLVDGKGSERLARTILTLAARAHP